jgi:hypothetical protein
MAIPSHLCTSLAGTWKLDPAQSDSMEPFLKMLGVPWIARKAAASAVPVMTIKATDGGGGIEIVQEGMMKLVNHYTVGKTSHKSPMGTHEAFFTVERAKADGTLVEGGEGSAAADAAVVVVDVCVLRTTMKEGKMQVVYVPAPPVKDGRRATLVVMTYTQAGEGGETVRLRRFFVEKK